MVDVVPRSLARMMIDVSVLGLAYSRRHDWDRDGIVAVTNDRHRRMADNANRLSAGLMRIVVQHLAGMELARYISLIVGSVAPNGLGTMAVRRADSL